MTLIHRVNLDELGNPSIFYLFSSKREQHFKLICFRFRRSRSTRKNSRASVSRRSKDRTIDIRSNFDVGTTTFCSRRCLQDERRSNVRQRVSKDDENSRKKVRWPHQDLGGKNGGGTHRIWRTGEKLLAKSNDDLFVLNSGFWLFFISLIIVYNSTHFLLKLMFTSSSKQYFCLIATFLNEYILFVTKLLFFKRVVYC